MSFGLTVAHVKLFGGEVESFDPTSVLNLEMMEAWRFSLDRGQNPCAPKNR